MDRSKSPQDRAHARHVFSGVFIILCLSILLNFFEILIIISILFRKNWQGAPKEENSKKEISETNGDAVVSCNARRDHAPDASVCVSVSACVPCQSPLAATQGGGGGGESDPPPCCPAVLSNIAGWTSRLPPAPPSGQQRTYAAYIREKYGLDLNIDPRQPLLEVSWAKEGFIQSSPPGGQVSFFYRWNPPAILIKTFGN